MSDIVAASALSSPRPGASRVTPITKHAGKRRRYADLVKHYTQFLVPKPKLALPWPMRSEYAELLLASERAFALRGVFNREGYHIVARGRSTIVALCEMLEFKYNVATKAMGVFDAYISSDAFHARLGGAVRFDRTREFHLILLACLNIGRKEDDWELAGLTDINYKFECFARRHYTGEPAAYSFSNAEVAEKEFEVLTVIDYAIPIATVDTWLLFYLQSWFSLKLTGEALSDRSPSYEPYWLREDDLYSEADSIPHMMNMAMRFATFDDTYNLPPSLVAACVFYKYCPKAKHDVRYITGYTIEELEESASLRVLGWYSHDETPCVSSYPFYPELPGPYVHFSRDDTRLPQLRKDMFRCIHNPSWYNLEIKEQAPLFEM